MCIAAQLATTPCHLSCRIRVTLQHKVHSRYALTTYPCRLILSYRYQEVLEKELMCVSFHVLTCN
jgi:hypothetical protein